ncbi:2-hydroxyglutaryl-CoA dehydratase [Candidatus Calescamantes bacterium]|nr:2-hydroxyglutaryl-CoA dehydratase [Candidatus Calescamantes bacterium]
MKIICGIDAGSTTTKIVLREGEKILSYTIFPTGTKVKEEIEKRLKECLEKAGRKLSDVSVVISTGYGRRLIQFADKTISEITANAKGAIWLSREKIRTIIDIGGQDSKAISLDEEGKIVNFAMNDKCAAGTGRFLEVMARVLEVGIEKMGEVSLKAEKAVNISSLCTVFAESEVISLLARGYPVPEIIAGLHRSIARRVGQLARKVGIREKVFFNGGGALNPGLRKALEEELQTKLIVPEIPQIVSALGATLVNETQS